MFSVAARRLSKTTRFLKISSAALVSFDRPLALGKKQMTLPNGNVGQPTDHLPPTSLHCFNTTDVG